MAWTKAKTAIIAGAVVLLAAGTTTMVANKTYVQWNSILKQELPDGSRLTINQISFGDTHKFVHGEKKNIWSWPEHDELIVEFKLASKDPENHALVKPAFYRQFRCVLRGEHGIEYVEEFIPNNFKKISDGYYGYVETSMFPRDSRWLWLRIEKREDGKRYDSWEKEAEFKIKNPATSQNLKWTASSTPVTNIVDGMNFVLDEITVGTVPNYTNDIWNHIVNVPTEIFDNGVLQTNWTATYTYVKDASGNWNSNLQSHRSLDPDYVWKLDMDFEPESNFPDGSLATMAFPKLSTTITTNVFDVPVTVAWDGYYLDVNIPTNRTDIALKFVSAMDEQGRKMNAGGSSWGRYNFREGHFMSWTGENSLTSIDVKPAKLTFAIVPNIHTTFYAQPRLITPQ